MSQNKILNNDYLASIHRLEFYKKKKNWKLSSRTMTPPKTSFEKDLLDKTGQCAPSNVTVAECGSGVEKSPKAELSEEIRELEMSETQNAAAILKYLKHKTYTVSQESLSTYSELNESPENSFTDYSQVLIISQDDSDEFNKNHSIGLFHMMRDSSTQTDIIPDNKDEDIEQDVDSALIWDSSVDSSGEFARGADIAPHSTEIDLELPNDAFKATGLTHLSFKQLVQEAKYHYIMLRKVQLEKHIRQELKNIQKLFQPNFNWEDIPNNYQYCASSSFDQGVLFNDAVVSGAHRNHAGVGRGRGRLNNFYLI